MAATRQRRFPSSRSARSPGVACAAIARAAVACATVACATIAAATPAQAGSIVVPIRLDEAFLRRLLLEQAFTLPGSAADLWQDADGCGHLTLREPEVEAVDGKLVVRAGGDARWGAAIGDRCFLPLTWKGRVEIVEEPQIEERLPIVHFRVVDTTIYGKTGKRTFLTSRLWDWMKAYVHPRMERVTVDLHGPFEEVRALLPLVLAPAYRDGADATLASVTPAGVRVEDGALVVELALASPQWDDGAAARPEPPLDVEEVEQWDAFLTFVVKRAALDVPDAEVRTALLGVLLESRYDIVAALLDASSGAQDPVPGLFRKAWERLAPVLRRFDEELPGADALRYLSFVAAGDALAAIAALGPGSGLDISADGLRRLARIVAPDEARDPLDFATTIDPELRERLGFGPPLPLPASPPQLAPAAPAAPRQAPPANAGTTTTSTTTTTTTRSTGPGGASEQDDDAGTEPPALYRSPPPPAARPPRAPEPAAPSTTLPPSPPSPLSMLWAWLVPAAEAAEDPIEELRAQLETWAPGRGDLDRYLPLVHTVLVHAAERTLEEKPVGELASPLFRPLVLATAWKETCWRQLVRRGGKVVPIESSAGAVGIMQVNPRVWRGFYDPAALRADLVYNAEAGSEIVRHYLVDYAIRKKEHEKGGGVDALAAATYAAYNGGPGHLSRYRSPTTKKSLRAIDQEFRRIYERVKGGDELGVRSCWP